MLLARCYLLCAFDEVELSRSESLHIDFASDKRRLLNAEKLAMRCRCSRAWPLACDNVFACEDNRGVRVGAVGARDALGSFALGARWIW